MAYFKIFYLLTLVTLTYSQTISIRPLGGDVFWEGGGPIDLKCIVLEDRFSNVYWIRDNTTVWSLNEEILANLSPNHKVTIGIGKFGRLWVDLFIETAQRKHSGFYTCLAEDPVTHEQIKAHQYIRVNHVPHQKYPLCLAENGEDPQMMSCVTEPGSPEVILKWFSVAMNSTELVSETAMEEGLLTQGLSFSNLYAPEGELLSFDTVFICKMYIEDYGALRSCSIDAQTVYALNSSFDILPSDLSVVFGESLVARCVSPLPLVTFTVTLHLPNRPPKRPPTIQVDNGVALVIHNINFDYNGAILSCQMGWGSFYGKTKMSRITVTTFIDPVEHEPEQDIDYQSKFRGDSQGDLDASPASERDDVSEQISRSLVHRYPSPTIDSDLSVASQNSDEQSVLPNPPNEWTVQLNPNLKEQNRGTLLKDYIGNSSTFMSETETELQNRNRTGTKESPTSSSEFASTSEYASDSSTATKQGEEVWSESLSDKTLPDNAISDAFHENYIRALPFKDENDEVVGNLSTQSKTTTSNGLHTLNGEHLAHDTSLDSSRTMNRSNIRSSGLALDKNGDGGISSIMESSVPVGIDNSNGHIDTFKMITSWTSEKPLGNNDISAPSSDEMPRKPDIPMENGTYYETENVDVISATVFILTCFLVFLVFLFYFRFLSA